MESQARVMWIGRVILIATGIGLLMRWSYFDGQMDMKKEAEERGYMEFQVSQRDGKLELVWK